MTRKMIAVAALTAAVLIPARPAAAQYGADPGTGGGQGPFAVTGGWLWNSGDTPENSQFTVGVQFANRMTASQRGQWVLSADWMNIESEAVPGVGASRRDVSFVPVLLNYKHHFNGGPFYLMAGAGAAWAEKDIPEMDITDRIGFVWQAGLGYSFGSWFVEGRYLAGTNPGDDGMIGGLIGISF